MRDTAEKGGAPVMPSVVCPWGVPLHSQGRRRGVWGRGGSRAREWRVVGGSEQCRVRLRASVTGSP